MVLSLGNIILTGSYVGLCILLLCKNTDLKDYKLVLEFGLLPGLFFFVTSVVCLWFCADLETYLKEVRFIWHKLLPTYMPCFQVDNNELTNEDPVEVVRQFDSEIKAYKKIVEDLKILKCGLLATSAFSIGGTYLPFEINSKEAWIFGPKEVCYSIIAFVIVCFVLVLHILQKKFEACGIAVILIRQTQEDINTSSH